MATKQITTWAEFKTALTETITENTTYEIMNDIDVSDEVLTGSINIVSNQFSKTINGGDHKINGLTHYSNFGVFNRAQPNVKIIFNNLYFSNFMLQTGYLFNFSREATSGYYTTFNNCYFSGLVNRLFSTGNSGNYIYTNFNRCSFNVQTNILLYSTGECSFNNCYIVINPMEGTTSCILWGRGSNTYYPAMNNCYVTGSLYIPYNTSDYIIGGTFWNDSSCYHNVFNVEIHITNYSASTTYYWTAGSPPDNRAELYNSEKIFDNAGNKITMGVRNNFYGLTDAQLKSKTAINQNAPHFPLWG